MWLSWINVFIVLNLSHNFVVLQLFFMEQSLSESEKYFLNWNLILLFASPFQLIDYNAPDLKVGIKKILW